jgi:hypothetical protein
MLEKVDEEMNEAGIFLADLLRLAGPKHSGR